MNKDPRKVADCKVCLMLHDEEIHEATMQVHKWFAFQVTKNLEPDETEAAITAA